MHEIILDKLNTSIKEVYQLTVRPRGILNRANYFKGKRQSGRTRKKKTLFLMASTPIKYPCYTVVPSNYKEGLKYNK